VINGLRFHSAHRNRRDERCAANVQKPPAFVTGRPLPNVAAAIKSKNAFTVSD